MTRLIFSFLFLLSALYAAPSAFATQDTACADIDAYLTMVDEQVIEQTMALVENPEWVAGAETLTAHLLANDGDVEGLTLEELDPMIQLWSVPMHVLGDVPVEEIPEGVQALHASSLDQWTTMPDVLNAMVTSGPFAAFAFLEELERITNANWAAQESVRATCADLVAGYDEQVANLVTMFAVMDSGDLSPIIEATAEDLDGLGVMYLFFALEEDVTGPPSDAISTPAT